MRTSKTVNGTDIITYYWMGDVLQGEQKSSKQGSQTVVDYYILYLYDENGAVYGFQYKTATTSEYYYYIFNAQGDVIGILDANGTKVVSYEYSAWGEVLSVTGTLANTIGQTNPIRYRGYYYDTETGFYYCNSRYYDTQTLRFINSDVINVVLVAPKGLIYKNQFAYCDNNPAVRGDNNGDSWTIIIIGCVVGAASGFLGQVATDVVVSFMNNEIIISNWQTYVGSTAGGIVGGIVLSTTGSVGWSNFAMGFAPTMFTQAIEKYTVMGYNKSCGDILTNSFEDGVLSYAVGEVLGVKGITSGKNSYSAVYKSGLTKIRNKYASRMSPKVVFKGVFSNVTDTTQSALYAECVKIANEYYSVNPKSRGGCTCCPVGLHPALRCS